MTAEESIMRPVTWVEVPVSDVQAAAERLHQLFGWQVQSPSTQAFALLLTGNRDPLSISLVIRETPAGGNDEPLTTMIGVNVGAEPLEDVLTRAVRLGFMPVEAPHAIPGAGHGMRAVVRDPDGNLFGLWRD